MCCLNVKFLATRLFTYVHINWHTEFEVRKVDLLECTRITSIHHLLHRLWSGALISKQLHKMLVKTQHVRYTGKQFSPVESYKQACGTPGGRGRGREGRTIETLQSFWRKGLNRGYRCADWRYFFHYIISYKTIVGAGNDRLPPHKPKFISQVYIFPAHAVTILRLLSLIKSHHISWFSAWRRRSYMCLNGIQFRVTADTKFLKYWRLKWIRYQQLLSLTGISMTSYRTKILGEYSWQRLYSPWTCLYFVQLVPKTTCWSSKPLTHINLVLQIPSPTEVFSFLIKSY